MPTPPLSLSLAANAALPPDGAGGGVRAAIARAAAASGVDFGYLMAQAQLESRLDPGATNPRSTARGLYQFTQGTWAQTLARHGDALDVALGGDGSGGAAVAGALADPAARARLMALRDDPQASATMAAALAGDNQATLTTALGRAPDAAELYLAHFLGADGATTFLAALAADPGQSAAALLPRAAAGNAAVFYEPGGAPRSVAGVMALVRARMAGAMAGTGDGAAPPMPMWGAGFAGAATAGELLPAATSGRPLPPGGPLAHEFAATASGAGAGDGTERASMAETLRSAFGMADAGAGEGALPAPIPAFVRNAYGRLQALGF